MTIHINKVLFWKLEHLKPSLRWKCRHFLSTLYIKSLIQEKNQIDQRAEEIGLLPSPISAVISRKIYGRQSWQHMVQILEELRAIGVCRRYVPNSQCRKFRLLRPYNQEIEPLTLASGSFHKRLVKTQEIQSYAATKGTPVRWVIDSFKASSISNSAKELLDSLDLPTPSARHCAEAALQAVQERQISFSRCDAGRLFYPVTSLKRELRRLILLDEETVCEIDASASQPMLHASLYVGDCVERARYIEFVTGPDFYETAASWGDFFGFRPLCKKLVFRDLFYGSAFRKTPSRIWTRFEAEFPILASLMFAIKKRGNSELPLQMQRIESRIVIDTACRMLQENRIPVLPVHDSLIVPVSKREEAQDIYRKSWKEIVGLEPKFKS